MRPVAQEVSTHSDDHPALGRKVGQPVDVSSVLVRVGPMLRTVVLDADLPLLPSHVDAADEFAVFVDDNDLRHPIMWIYDGVEPTSHVAGLMYYSMSRPEPKGFAGPNDAWHYHTGLCLVYGNGGIDLPYGADQDVSKQQCDGVHGQLMKQSQWMVHVWTVPGYESSLGTFSHLNPAITCKDGTYYSMPLSSNIGTRASLCRAA